MRSREFFRTNRTADHHLPGLVECIHLMFKRIGIAKHWHGWMRCMRKGSGCFVATQQHLPRLQYVDAPVPGFAMDLADASLVLLAEELGEGRIVGR